MASQLLTIGVLAERAGVGPETLRFYEREGLLPKPGRTAAGYRTYTLEAVARVQFIRSAKELGFTLDEIVELLALRVSHGKSCTTVRKRAAEKLVTIDAKLAELRRMRTALTSLITHCNGDEGTDDCTILDRISRGNHMAPRRKKR